MNLRDKLSAIPHTSGIYLMRDIAGEILYIGKARDLKKRVGSYFHGKKSDQKTAALLSNVRLIDYLITHSEKEALVLEDRFIKKLQPKYNVIWRDDKSYPYLKLTLSENFPRIYFTRQIKRNGDKYYGPYPNVREVRNLIKWIRKVFPLRYCKLNLSCGKKMEPRFKACLYYHIKQCPAPCLRKISKSGYRKIVGKLKLFLEGKYENLKRLWIKEMQRASLGMEFEKASIIRNNIRALEYMFERINFRHLQHESDLIQALEISRALSQVKDELNLPEVPLAIEAFDVSNIAGQSAVGSMVKFLNGSPDRSNYRKYKIKTVKDIDDYSMLSEVVRRRCAHLIKEGNALPDLMLIDGGKGQLSRIMDTLRGLDVKGLPVASIAKREETIFLPEGNGGSKRFREIRLSYDSKALHLIQQIRDESHRFALTYHKLIRKKELFIKREK